jgi:hypothetical protein
MAAPVLLKKFSLSTLLRPEVSVALGPIVWLVAILGVSLVIVYGFANRAPADAGGSETVADNTALGTLYDARGESESSTATVRRNSSGGRDGPKVASGNARHAWGGAIKRDLTGPAAVLPATARPKRDSLERSQALDAGAAMAVQRELHRRGCYAGHIDGDWGPTSRFAAAMFFDGSRADVSLAKVDDVLLALSRQPADHGCNEAVGSLSRQIPSPQVQYVTVEVDGVVVGGTTNKREAWQAPRMVGSNGATIEPGFVGGRRNVGDENGEETQKKLSVEANTQHRTQRSHAVSASQKRRRKRWKQQVYQGINLSGN